MVGKITIHMIPPSAAFAKMIRRHAHDIRNHCSGIDMDATLLEMLSEDTEMTAVSVRLKKQVARIEADLKLLLVKLDTPQPVSLTVGDLLQLWKMKLGTVELAAITVAWPTPGTFPAIMLDPRIVVPLLCDFTFRLGERQPGEPLEITVREQGNRIRISVIPAMDFLALPQDYMDEVQTLLEAGGMSVESTLDPATSRWTVSFDVPCTGLSGT